MTDQREPVRDTGDEVDEQAAERSPEIPQASPSEAAEQAEQAEGNADRAAEEEQEHLPVRDRERGESVVAAQASEAQRLRVEPDRAPQVVDVDRRLDDPADVAQTPLSTASTTAASSPA